MIQIIRHERKTRRALISLGFRKLLLQFCVLFTTELTMAQAAGSPCSLQETFPLTYNGSYEAELVNFVNNGGKPSEGFVSLRSDRNNGINSPSISEVILQRFPVRSFKTFVNDRAHRLEMGYKFALSANDFPAKNCEFKVSQYEYRYDSDPARNVHHHLLAGGEKVHSAGAIFFFHDGQKLEKIFVTNRSSRFCPSFESLELVRKIFNESGITDDLIEFADGGRGGCSQR